MKDFLQANTDQMAFDHVAYLVRDTDASINAFSHMAPVVTMYREPLDVQRVYISFLEDTRSGQKIELVEPFAENAVMQARLDREGQQSVLYHICYNVTEFDAVFSNMRKSGWMPLTMPFIGMTPGCRASHMYNPHFGVVEIAEVHAL